MEIKRVIPSGYCKGVIRAIQMAKQARIDYPQEKIYVLGMIVHNHYVAEALEKLNIITLDANNKEEAINSIDNGVLIFSAHGIADKYKKMASDKGLIVIDASCVDVIATQNIVKKHLNEGYRVFYIGKKNHPEAEAVLSISSDIILINSEDDIPSNCDKAIFVTNQTTMSIFEIANIFEAIKKKYPNALFEKEICKATTMRQEAVLKLKDCDLLIVVGDPKSNNSNKLKEIGLLSGIKKVIMIEEAMDLKLDDLKDCNHIYVTAGASTPTSLTNAVIETLKKFALNGELIKPDVNLDEIL